MPTRRGGVVAVDDRDADPVVAGSLAEGERQHEHADQQRARLAPRRRSPRPVRLAGASSSAASTSWSSTKARTAARDGEPDDHGHADHVRRHRKVGRDRDGADQRAGDRADAPPGVEPRHDRLAEQAFDEGSLHVHPDVPGAVAEAEEEQPGGHRPDAELVAGADQEQPGGEHRRHRGDRAPRARAGDTSAPEIGSATTEPAAMASSSRPSRDGVRCRCCLTAGIRAAQLANANPDPANAA